MRRAFATLACWILVWGILCPASYGATTGRQPVGASYGDSYVQIKEVFSHTPPSGFCPLIVTVKNDTSEPMVFAGAGNGRNESYYNGEDEVASVFSVVAPKGQTSTHVLLVPVPLNVVTTSYHSQNRVSLILSGPSQVRFYGNESVSSKRQPLAMSKKLTADNIGTINAALGNEIASQFDAAELPNDWRAFSGFDRMAMASSEWLSLAPTVKRAVLQWVKFGGTFVVYTEGNETLQTLQLPQADSLGSGEMVLYQWDGKVLPQRHLKDYYDDGPKDDSLNRLEGLVSNGKNQWSALEDSLGSRNFGAWQVGVILVVFGILVGPVNLFYFAKPGRRHRLFFTTPIISIGASLLLIACILLQDGTGGQGVRTSLVYVEPATATVSIHQDQASRSGVLFATSFQTDEAAVVSPARMRPSRWTRDQAYRTEGRKYLQSDAKTFSGDWFRSRMEQGQSIQLVRSSRGRLELASKAGDPVVLRSSFAYPLETVYYVDAASVMWKSVGPLKTGSSVSFEKSTSNDYRDTLAKHRMNSHSQVRKIEGQPGHFYAFTTDPGAEFVATLNSVKWNSNLSLVWGPVPAVP